MHEQEEQLRMPESAVRTDEISRQKDRRRDTMFAQDGKGKVIIVPPAIVKRDNAQRACKFRIWDLGFGISSSNIRGWGVRICRTGKIRNPKSEIRIYQGGEGNDMEVLFEKVELAVESFGSHYHARL
jgi:hypothetical protein